MQKFREKTSGVIAALVLGGLVSGCSLLEKSGLVEKEDVASACVTAIAICQSPDVEKTPQQAQACAVIIATCASLAK